MFRKIFSYGTLAIVSVTLQIILIAYAVTAGGKIPAVGFFYRLLTLCTIFYILSLEISSAYKLIWIVVMLLFPLYGGVAYLLFNKIHSVNAIHHKMHPYLTESMKKVKGNTPETPLQHYLSFTSGFPLLKSRESCYYPDGEPLFETMLEKISKAKRYIYLEFFIISDGEAWHRMEKLLAEKVNEGVDVRIIADSAGCLFVKPQGFKKRLNEIGVKYREFNPVSLRASGRVNYRNHRKILVCDGEYAFCCGINISDEYMNYKERFGRWKDTGIMVSGEGAESFSAMFCGMWNYLSDKNEISVNFKKEGEENGDVVQPFSETPLDNEAVGLRTYLSLISSAKSNVYLTTPYLICDDEMLNALTFATRRGVRVIIITPGIPDKRFVYALTRSYYKALLSAGAEIYEYSPGFIHSKTLVIDDDTAVCGTINFDCRSMHLLFECACIFYGGTVPSQIADDFCKTLTISQRITDEVLPRENLIVRIVRGFLRLFAPLL